MYFDSFADFLAMGKHAPYVWSAYALSLGSIITMQIYTRLRHRRLQRLLHNLKDNP